MNFSLVNWERRFRREEKRRARVALFAGCIANVTFSKLNEATIRVLTANGCEVVVPQEQFCCGALAAHAGVRDTARELARKNMRGVWEPGEFDAIVTNAAGCGSTLKEYDASVFGWNEPEHAAAIAFRKQSAGRDGISGGVGLVGKAEASAGARDLPGFLPSAARSKGKRGAAAIIARDSRRGICGIAVFRYLLRIGGRLQRNADRSVAGFAVLKKWGTRRRQERR